ncbi:MAG: endonuclease/exonuclease/phosphatase family protein [Actinomycetes bacterium]
MAVRRQLTVLVASAALLVGTVPGGAATERDPTAKRRVTVATYNLYIGGDIGTLVAPGVDTLPEFLGAAAALWGNVVATNFPERAEAIADLLAADQPDVVGLQEVALWESGPPGAGVGVTYDFLAILLAELAERGAPYRAVVTNTNFVSPVVPLPPPVGLDVRFTDRDVVIARADLPRSRLSLSRPRPHVFAASVPITLPFVSTSILRGWSTIDVTVGSRTYRLANTHLEAFSAAIRRLQAVELAAALRRSRHPLVLVGDLNADPGTGAARLLRRRVGMADAWREGSGSRFTAGQDDLLRNDPSTLDRRIDFVLYEADRRPDVDARAAHVIGEEASDRTSSGMWPSDHAGVVARLRLTRP